MPTAWSTASAREEALPWRIRALRNASVSGATVVDIFWRLLLADISTLLLKIQHSTMSDICPTHCLTHSLLDWKTTRPLPMKDLLQRLFRSRYVALLEQEVDRLRAENRALVNSLLGTAGFPPVNFPEAPAVRSPQRIRPPSSQQFQTLREAEPPKAPLPERTP